MHPTKAVYLLNNLTIDCGFSENKFFLAEIIEEFNFPLLQNIELPTW